MLFWLIVCLYSNYKQPLHICCHVTKIVWNELWTCTWRHDIFKLLFCMKFTVYSNSNYLFCVFLCWYTVTIHLCEKESLCCLALSTFPPENMPGKHIVSYHNTFVFRVGRAYEGAWHTALYSCARLSLGRCMEEEDEESPVAAYALTTAVLLLVACVMCLCLMCCAKWWVFPTRLSKMRKCVGRL